MTDVCSTILGAPGPSDEHNSTSTHGQTLLELLRHGHRDEALSRTSNKDEINQVDDGSTPLLVATTRGWEDVVEALVRNGANVNCISDLGETPLMRAIKCGKISPFVIKLILDSGGVETLNQAAKESAFFSQWTALHFACDTEMNHSPVIIALLVAYGANVKAVAGNGKTPSEMCDNNQEYGKALQKPREYLKHHTVALKAQQHHELEEGRRSAEPMFLGSEIPDDGQARSSILQNAINLFSLKPKKSSLIQTQTLPPVSPIASDLHPEVERSKSRLLSVNKN